MVDSGVKCKSRLRCVWSFAAAVLNAVFRNGFPWNLELKTPLKPFLMQQCLQECPPLPLLKMSTFEKLMSYDNWTLLPSDSPYSVFWNSLKESKLKDGLLDFGMINPIEGTFRTIIARKCYFNLWNILNGPDAVLE